MSAKDAKDEYRAIIRCSPYALVHATGLPLPIIRAVRREASVALFGEAPDGVNGNAGESKSQESGMSVVDMLSARSDDVSSRGAGMSSIFLTLSSADASSKQKEDSGDSLRNASVLNILTKRNGSDTFESEVLHSSLYELALTKNDKIDRHLGYLEVLRLYAMNGPRKATTAICKLEHRGGLIVDLQRKPFIAKKMRIQKSTPDNTNDSTHCHCDVIDLSFACAKAGLKVLLIDSCNDIGVETAFFRNKMKDKMKTLATEMRDMDTDNVDDQFTQQLQESTLDRIHLQTVDDVWELMNVCKSISVKKEDCFDVILMSDFRKLMYSIDVPSGDTKSVQMLRTILASIQSSMFNLTSNNSLLFVINESYELERNLCSRCAKKRDKQLFCEYCSELNIFNRLLHFLYRGAFDCVVNMR